MSKLTLRPGDGVNITNADAKTQRKLADAFIAAGAEPGLGYPYDNTTKAWKWMIWDAGSSETNRVTDVYGNLISREISIDDILGVSTKTDVITALLAAKTSRDEAERKYQEALKEVCKQLGDDFTLTEEIK